MPSRIRGGNGERRMRGKNPYGSGRRPKQIPLPVGVPHSPCWPGSCRCGMTGVCLPGCCAGGLGPF